MKLFLMLFICGFFFFGCWAPKSIITTEHATIPVLVGNVIAIGGDTIDFSRLIEFEKFSAQVDNMNMIVASPYGGGTLLDRQPGRVIDNQLLPLIDIRDRRPNDFILVEQFRHDVFSVGLFFVTISSNDAWFDGTIYRLNY